MFLNRRGFSTQVLCPECGYRMMCPDCDITLTYHKRDNAAICHYCGRKFKIPEICPECGNSTLSFIGTGTERLEETIEGLVPNAKVGHVGLYRDPDTHLPVEYYCQATYRHREEKDFRR